MLSKFIYGKQFGKHEKIAQNPGKGLTKYCGAISSKLNHCISFEIMVVFPILSVLMKLSFVPFNLFDQTKRLTKKFYSRNILLKTIDNLIKTG